MTADSDLVGNEADTTLPLLTTLAVQRSGDDEIPGRYCEEKQVWVVDTDAGAMPLVEANTASSELVTKTKVRQEQDDQGGFALLEGITKTSVVQERDDVGRSAFCLPELVTKTDVVRERDD